MGVCCALSLFHLDHFSYLAYSQRPIGTRTFHYLSALILTISTIAYFALASNLGGTPVAVEFRGHGLTRAVWYGVYAINTTTARAYTA